MHLWTYNIIIHVWYDFNLITWIGGHGVLLLCIFLFVLPVKLWMQFPKLLMCMTVNVIMFVLVVGIFVVTCCVFHFLCFSPFVFFFPSLEVLTCSFYFDPLYFPFFWSMLSRYYSHTQALSTNVGLNKITCFQK